MNIIDIYDKLKSSYKNYIGSFVSIKDERIKQKVSEAIQDEKLLILRQTQYFNV